MAGKDKLGLLSKVTIIIMHINVTFCLTLISDYVTSRVSNPLILAISPSGMIKIPPDPLIHRCECLWSCCKRQRKVTDVGGSQVENQEGCADSGKPSGSLNNGSIPMAGTDNKDAPGTSNEFVDSDSEDGHSIEYQTPV